MSPDREGISPEMMTSMYSEGARRAAEGKPIVMELVRGIEEPRRVKAYLHGYMGVVENELHRIGILNPEKLGIHETFEHIVIQDEWVSGTSGIHGLNNGMCAVQPFETPHEDLGESALNHYRDGYKIGTAFAGANVRRGKFEAIAAIDNIPKPLREELGVQIKEWFRDFGINVSLPEFILRLNPVSRLSFVYGMTNGEWGFAEYSARLTSKVLQDTTTSNEEKEVLLKGIMTSFDLAKRVKLRQTVI